MKKWLSLLLAVMLCAACSCGAAEITIEKIAEPEISYGYLGATNLLINQIKYGTAQYILMKENGELLRSEIFSGSGGGRYGYVWYTLDYDDIQSTGLIDIEGNTVIPFCYSNIIVLNENWAVAFVVSLTDSSDETDTRFAGAKILVKGRYDRIDVYNLKNKQLVASMNRDEYEDAQALGEIINILDDAGNTYSYDENFNLLGEATVLNDGRYSPDGITVYEKKGGYGARKPNGEEVFSSAYSSEFDFYGDYAAFGDGEVQGLIDRQGNIILQPEYGEILLHGYSRHVGLQRYEAEGYFGVNLNNKLAWVNRAGKITHQTSYAMNKVKFYGASATVKDKEGKLHILAADGADTVVEGYKTVEPLKYSGGKLYVTSIDVRDNTRYGLIDWHGNELIACFYNGKLKLSGDGCYVIANDYTGNSIFKVIYPDRPEKEELPEQAVAIPEVKYTFTKGYESATRINFAENSNFLVDWGADEEKYERRILTSSGIPLNDELYGAVQYEHGFFAVQEQGFSTGGMKLMDTSGKVISDTHYDLTILSEYWAKATNRYLLEGGGELSITALYDLHKGELIGEVDENKFRVIYAAGDVLNLRNMETGEFISCDKKLNILGVVENGSSEEFANMPGGVRRVCKDELWGLKDFAGNWVLGSQFDSVGRFIRGYATMKHQGLVGVTTPTGRCVVEPKYDSIETTQYAPYDMAAKAAALCADGYFTAIDAGEVVFIHEESGEVFKTGIDKKAATLCGASLTYTAEDGTKHLLSADGVDTPLAGYENVYALPYHNGKLISASDKDDNTYILDWHGNVVLTLENAFVNSVSGDGSMMAVTDWDGGYYVLHIEKTLAETQAGDAEISQYIGVGEGMMDDIQVKVTLDGGKIAKVEVISHSETRGLGSKAIDQLPGKMAGLSTAAEIDALDAIAGATVTSKGLKAAVKAALAQVPRFEPVPESTPEPEPPVSVNPVVTMIDTAILLLDTDAAANKAQAVSLLSGASTLIGETNPSATTLLTSVVTLLDVDAAGNAASVKMVLESVKAML